MVISHYLVKLLGRDTSPSDTAPNVRVVFRQHISQICKCCFYRISKCNMSLSAAKTTSTALISSRLDYSLLNNIAKTDLAKLQLVKNCLARVVLSAPRVSPSQPLLEHLQWFPLTYRINFKLSTLSTQQPPYPWLVSCIFQIFMAAQIINFTP